MSFKLGKSVRFKDGQKDEDSGIDIGGWQGRVAKIDKKHNLLLLELDSITLKSLSREYLEECEEKGLGWTEYNIGFNDVEPSEPRDTKKDVTETVNNLTSSLGWVYLGEEGREINAILDGADGIDAELEAWDSHLEKVLTFPFSAEISEWQRPGTALQSGQKVRVLGIEEFDESYGLLVKIRKSRQIYLFPLCDLEVIPNKSPHHAPVQLYAVWYANR